jgi:polyphosphate kinase 2 (PPK2 family)
MALAVKVRRGFALAELDLARRLADEAKYKRRLQAGQVAMLDLEQAFHRDGSRGIVVFEGWDAGGKDGAIQRLTARLDPRWIRVWSIGKPTPEEQGRHYLWRFWERLPPPGYIAIFDRSWYGRVLVERVEGLTPRRDWRRAFDEINQFEKLLVEDGVRLVKLFLHVSAAEQQKRLAERIADPVKHWKIAADDIRNFARRREYLAAIEEMFARTSTKAAPWRAIAGDYKWFARVAAIDTVVKTLGNGLQLGPLPVDEAVYREAAALLDPDTVAALGLAQPTKDREGHKT